MFDYLYGWLRDISYYLILVTAVTYVLPSNSYRKYIRFFTGLVLILMLMTPVLHLLGMNVSDGEMMFEKYEAELQQTVPEFIKNVNEVESKNTVYKDKENEYVQDIEVEDIVIGP